MAGQVLAAAGADLERVRAEVVRLLAEYQRRMGQPEAGSGDADGDGLRRAGAGRGREGLDAESGSVRYEGI